MHTHLRYTLIKLDSFNGNKNKSFLILTKREGYKNFGSA